MTMAIATAAAGKITESLTDGARESVAAIVRRIREKFRQQPAALATLEAACDDPARIQDLAALLDEAMTRDPEFGHQIRALWQQTAIRASDEGVVNVFRGHAEKVVQLRDVHGDLSIH
jgi:hypothetical protein